MKINGIHHISNIVKHPQENIDFYAGMLGLRLIKKAVNFDSANTYHFYFGNHQANSGTVITSFPIGRNTKDGLIGGGMASSTYYIIPKGSFDFWLKRLTDFNLNTSIIERFGKKHLVFDDYLGIRSELVESNKGITNLYEFNGVTKDEAIKGFYGVEIFSTNPLKTKEFFLNYLEAKALDEDNNYYRLTYSNKIGNIIDIKKEAKTRGRLSKGTVHHVALEIDSLKSLEEIKERLNSDGYKTSDIKNRNFFYALYFREPGGTVIELSTNKPGFSAFTIDDRATELYLPDHFENKRSELESTMTPVFVREVKELKKYHYEGMDEYNDYVDHFKTLDRINELAKISKKRTLTNEEISEREILRNKYLKTITSNVSNNLGNIEFVDSDGHLQKMNKKEVN